MHLSEDGDRPGDRGPARARPLDGYCVVEIGHSLAAPYAGNILAQLGARVIKIEASARGDHARGWGPPFIDGASALFHAVNNGKQSVRADFDDPACVQAVRRLVAEHADVVLQNLRRGALERHGLDAAALTASAPGLVYCNLGAFGASGPMAGEPGYDPLMQAFSGMMSIIGHDGDEPSRVPLSLNDMGTGMWAVIGVLAVLARRPGRTPRARAPACTDSIESHVVDVSLLETALSWMTVPLTDRMAGGARPQRNGSSSPNIVPYQVFRCADGEMMVAAGNDLLFARLCEGLDSPAIAADPRFTTNGGRVEHRDELIALLEPRFLNLSVRECVDRMSARSIPCGPLHSVDQVIAHPQAEALGIFRSTPDGRARTVALPISFDGERPALAGNAPGLGEHDWLLAKAGP